jgi:hypothetical protein
MRWPGQDNFESLYQLYQERYPGSNCTHDQVSLMVCWVSLRLPYQLPEAEDDGGEA